MIYSIVPFPVTLSDR